MNSQPLPADGPVAGPSGIALPVTAFSRTVDRLIGIVGEFASLLWTVLMLVIVVQVVLRYVFGLGSIMLEEVQWHLYAVGFLLGLSFTEVHERNVRIDVLAERWSQRTRLWIELFGICCFLLGFSLVVVWFAVPWSPHGSWARYRRRPGACPGAGRSSRSWSRLLRCWHWPGWGA